MKEGSFKGLKVLNCRDFHINLSGPTVKRKAEGSSKIMSFSEFKANDNKLTSLCRMFFSTTLVPLQLIFSW